MDRPTDQPPQVKALLRPQLVQREASQGSVRRLLPPSYSLLTGRKVGESGWGPFEKLAKTIEGPFAAAPRNAHEALFGPVGRNGPACAPRPASPEMQACVDLWHVG